MKWRSYRCHRERRWNDTAMEVNEERLDDRRKVGEVQAKNTAIVCQAFTPLDDWHRCGWVLFNKELSLELYIPVLCNTAPGNSREGTIVFCRVCGLPGGGYLHTLKHSLINTDVYLSLKHSEFCEVLCAHTSYTEYSVAVANACADGTCHLTYLFSWFSCYLTSPPNGVQRSCNYAATQLCGDTGLLLEEADLASGQLAHVAARDVSVICGCLTTNSECPRHFLSVPPIRFYAIAHLWHRSCIYPVGHIWRLSPIVGLRSQCNAGDQMNYNSKRRAGNSGFSIGCTTLDKTSSEVERVQGVQSIRRMVAHVSPKIMVPTMFSILDVPKAGRSVQN
ncbi:hypothetical protein EDC04DRAFT_2610337 [Pisolithus marmoratus]|nr:hypothetical protein EDC04DRAFT_2610337 [Pisolithus marmoratus]